MTFMDSIRDMFQKSIPDIVIKYSNVAASMETIESRKNGDQYVAAVLKSDKFTSYISYGYDVLVAAGLNPVDAAICMYNRDKIPKEKRQKVLEEQRKYIIENYEEQNNYYRMLCGLPDMDDVYQIWLPYEVYLKYNITPMAVHLIDHNKLLILESMGELQPIIDENPDVKYLRHLGVKRIDPSASRLADNFQVLYFPKLDGGDVFYKDFMNTYEECREYFLTVIYNQYHSGRYQHYDQCLAFDILIMTIGKIIPKSMQRYVEREFYDVDTVRIFLESYGIKYNSIFTLAQLKLIAKNLNMLLKSKSSDKVFLDILELLGYSNFNIMKYYLIKQQRFDEEGKPIFVYKTEQDENGNDIEVLDRSKMFDHFFVKAEIGTYDVQDAMHDAVNRLEYRDVVTEDEYWIEDKTLVDKLNEAEFNYIETKYMDITVIYRMHAILFETIYLTRMVLDKRDETQAIMVSLPSITGKQIPLFDVFILLICELCKYYHVEPDLLKSPSKILHILGYNFKADFDAIKAEIANRPDLDDRLIRYIKNTFFTTPSDVNNLYVNVKELESLLVKLRNEADNHDTYSAYDKLYRTLMWTELNNDIYRLPDGTIPDKFTEYLEVCNPDLYVYLETLIDNNAVSRSIDYITAKLSNMFTDTKYLQYIKILDTNHLEAIQKLLCFFKSYTVMMKDISMILLLDSRYYNMIHFSTEVDFSGLGPTKLIIPDNTMIDMISDCLSGMVSTEELADGIKIDAPMIMLTDMIAKSKLYMPAKMTEFASERIFTDVFASDGIDKYFSKTLTRDRFSLTDAHLTKMYIHANDDSTSVYDRIYEIVNNYISDELHIIDGSSMIQSNIDQIDNASIEDSKHILSNAVCRSSVSTRDTYKLIWE